MMKKYNMGGLSMTEPKRYRKINAVLTGRCNKKKDFLDVVNTIPLDYASDVVDEGSTPDDAVFISELKVAITKGLSILTPREEIILEMRFGIGKFNCDYTLEDVGRKFNVTRNRIRQIEATALRKLRHNHPFRDFLDAT